MLALADRARLHAGAAPPICLLVARRDATLGWSEQPEPPIYVRVAADLPSTVPTSLEGFVAPPPVVPPSAPSPEPPPQPGRIVVVGGLASVAALQRRGHCVEVTDEPPGTFSKGLRYRAESALPDLVLLAHRLLIYRAHHLSTFYKQHTAQLHCNEQCRAGNRALVLTLTHIVLPLKSHSRSALLMQARG